MIDEHFITQLCHGYLHDLGGIFNIPDDNPILLDEWITFSKCNIEDYVDLWAIREKIIAYDYYGIVTNLIIKKISDLNMSFYQGIPPEVLLSFIKKTGFYDVKSGKSRVIAPFRNVEIEQDISKFLLEAFIANFPKTTEFSRSKKYRSYDDVGQIIHTAYLYDQFSAYIWACHGEKLRGMPVERRAQIESVAFSSLRPMVEG